MTDTTQGHTCDRAKIRRFVDQQKRSGFVAPKSGGLADGRSIRDFDTKALADGVCVELEHTSDRETALRIAMDHLVEMDDYYDRLATIESNLRERRLAHRLIHP